MASLMWWGIVCKAVRSQLEGRVPSDLAVLCSCLWRWRRALRHACRCRLRRACLRRCLYALWARASVRLMCRYASHIVCLTSCMWCAAHMYTEARAAAAASMQLWSAPVLAVPLVADTGSWRARQLCTNLHLPILWCFLACVRLRLGCSGVNAGCCGASCCVVAAACPHGAATAAPEVAWGIKAYCFISCVRLTPWQYRHGSTAGREDALPGPAAAAKLLARAEGWRRAQLRRPAWLPARLEH